MSDQIPYPQCVLAESKFAVMVQQVENLIKTVDKLNTAIIGNGKPGIVSELSTIKAHIGFNQERTIHERMTAIETILVKQEERDRQNNDTFRKIALPIVDRLITFGLGGVAYVIVTQLVK